MGRLTSLLAFAAILLLVPAAEAKPRKRCAVPGAVDISSNSKAIMLRRTITNSSGTREEVWGCLRARRRPVLVHVTGGTPEAGSLPVATVLTGRFIATAWDAWAEDGSCSAGLTVFSLNQEREKHGWRASGHQATGCPGLYSLRFGGRGRTVALMKEENEWVLRKFDATGQNVLDRGLDIELVEVIAGVIHWMKDGVSRYDRFY
jgi:hypothetical protein